MTMPTLDDKLERAALEALSDAVESGEYDLAEVMDECLDAACVEWPSDADHALTVALGVIGRAIAGIDKLARVVGEIERLRDASEVKRKGQQAWGREVCDVRIGLCASLLRFIASLDDEVDGR
ncbi:hypothetical protein LCGC14_0983330 [marine sediment metagenome]|uniref:Uncharacterized protein n=1 Tax=marine sediment metagenome TaxID=412755 RepID=A0A0F9NCI9_9ZZZZ